MPMRRNARRVAKRRPHRHTVASVSKTPRDLAIERVICRDLSGSAAETLFFKAELALVSGNHGQLTRTLRRLTNPDVAWMVDLIVSIRLRWQIEVARGRGWSDGLMTGQAKRSWPNDPGRVDLLLDAVASQDGTPTGPAFLEQWTRDHQATRLDALVTAVFVDLWLIALSTYDPSEIADDDVVGVHDAHAR